MKPYRKFFKEMIESGFYVQDKTIKRSLIRACRKLACRHKRQNKVQIKYWRKFTTLSKHNENF